MLDVVDILARTAEPVRGALASLTGDLARRDFLILGGILIGTQLGARLGMWAYCLLVLPGTLAHELTHWGVALLLRARPSLPSLIPSRTSDGWRLGSVTFHAGPLRAVPIAVAPLVLAPLSLIWASSVLPGAEVDSQYLLHAWGASTALGAAMPSRQDWRLAAPALGLAAVALVLWALR
jgi:hypothetical protein